MAVVTLIDRPKSVRNCSIIDNFDDRFCVVTLILKDSDVQLALSRR